MAANFAKLPELVRQPPSDISDGRLAK